MVRLIKNTTSQSLFLTQWSIRLTIVNFYSRYNAALFLSISLISLHYSAIACSTSDNNSTCAGFTVNCQKMLIQITFKTKDYGKYGLTTEQRKQRVYEYC